MRVCEGFVWTQFSGLWGSLGLQGLDIFKVWSDVDGAFAWIRTENLQESLGFRVSRVEGLGFRV